MRRSDMSGRAMLFRRLILPVLAFTGFFFILGCGGKPAQPPSHFVRQISWAGNGRWVKAETHVHTKFSDGAYSLAEVADRAAQFGCNVLAITDHADKNLRAATPKYAEAIQAARTAHPDMVILAGLEWNVPPWGGDDHATVLAPPGPDEWRLLKEFKEQFDDYHRKPHDPALADQALRWLAKQATTDGLSPLVIFNHPSRRWAKSTEIVPHLEHWRQINDLLIGFEGAPGHQRSKPFGAYKYKEKTIDRWDPAAARVGDVWDQLLQKGYDLWAAQTSTDFHKTSEDFWPGQFAETWLYVPECTAAGVLRAFRAGSFFAAHGHIVREVDLLVEAPGLPRPAQAGEAIEVPPGTSLKVSLRLQVPKRDWQNAENRIDNVELIVISKDATQVAASLTPQPTQFVLIEDLKVPAEGLVLRARGKRKMDPEPALMFYTNTVRVTVAR
jgi:hypothetical protein